MKKKSKKKVSKNCIKKPRSRSRKSKASKIKKIIKFLNSRRKKRK